MTEQPGGRRTKTAGVGLGGEGAPFDLERAGANTDAEIAQGVHAALALEPDVDADRYAVDVEHGEVRLVGRIHSPEERQRAIAAASRVHGVRRVVDQLAECRRRSHGYLISSAPSCWARRRVGSSSSYWWGT